MAWFVGQSLLVIVVAFLLGVLVSWLWWGRRRPVTTVAGAAQPAVVEQPVENDAALVPGFDEPEPEAEPEPQPEPEPEPQPQPGPEPEPEPEVEPVVAVVPAQAGPPDDLQRIEGIGPKMSGALVAAGIRTYAQLAGSDEATLRAAIEAAGLNFAPSLVTWARQARLLADGDEAGFEDLTRRLVAGRDVGRQ